MNCCWMLFVCLLLFSQLRSSSVSVVFDFNDPLNDLAPMPPMLLPVGLENTIFMMQTPPVIKSDLLSFD